MSEMIEQVARAIAEEINGGKFDDTRWYNDDQREVHRRRARAAIQAMREPTIEMCRDAAWDDYGPDACQTCWRTMIDLALIP